MYVNEDSMMVGRGNGIEEWNASAFDCREEVSRGKDVINAFSASCICRTFVFAMQVLHGIDERVFVEDHVKSKGLFPNSCVEVAS